MELSLALFLVWAAVIVAIIQSKVRKQATYFSSLFGFLIYLTKCIGKRG